MIPRLLRRLTAILSVVLSITLIGGCTEALSDDDSALRGHVYDATGAALEQAIVTVSGTSDQVLTDEDGVYVLNLEPGNYTLAAEKTGFSKRELTIEIEDSQAELNFTLQPKSAQEAVHLLLDGGDESFTAAEEVTLSLTVSNSFSHAITIAEYGFLAETGSNEVLWSDNQTPVATLTLNPDQSTTLTSNWLWSTNTPTLTPGSTVQCSGYIRLLGETERETTNSLDVELLSFTPKPEVLAFNTVEQGFDSPIRTLTTSVIKTNTDWQTFWASHGNGSTLPSVDFSQSMVIAAMGGEIATGGSHVAILALEHITGNNEITCRLTRLYPTGEQTIPGPQAPYHIIITATRSETVTFVWEQIDLGP